MPTESAVAYVSVVPQAKGAGKLIEQQIDPAGLGASVGDKMSGSFLKRVGSMAVKTTAVIGGAVTAIGASIAAVAAKKGIARLLDIDDAKGKLAGLKLSAKDVTTVMDNALTSVQGTAFGLGDAAGIASNAVAAGIKPGKELTKYLSLTADAATIAGVSLGEMGSIINKTTTSGKVYTDTLNQLADRNIPIFQWLQKEYGVSAEALSKMVSDGKVDAATFRKVIEENIGGAALESGKTVRGAWDNVGAALGRLGAIFGAGAIAGAPQLFTSIKEAVDRGTKALQPYADVLNAKVVAGMASLSAWIDRVDLGKIITGLSGIYDLVVKGDFSGKLSSAFGIQEDSQFVAFILGARDAVTGFFSALGGGDVSSAVGSVGASLATLGPAFAALGAQLPSIGGAVAKLAAAGITILAGALGFLADHVDTIIKYLPLIIAGYLAWRLASALATSATLALRTAELLAIPAQIQRNLLRLEAARLEYAASRATSVNTGSTVLNTAATNQNANALGRLTLAQRISAIATGIGTTASLIGAGALRVFGSAVRFAMGPLGIIIAIIGAVVAALVWFFTQTELGKSIVQTVFAAIQTAVAWLGDAFTWLWENAIKPAWDGISAGAVWLWENALKPVFDGITAGVQAVGGFFVALWTNYIQPPLTAIGNAVGYLWSAWISPVFQLIGAIFKWVGALIGTAVSAIVGLVVDTLGAAFNWLWTAVIQPVFGFIGAYLTVWWGTVSAIFGWVVGFVRDTLGAVFSWLWTGVIQPVFGFIGTAISLWWNGLVLPVFNAVVGTLRNVLGPVFSWLWTSIIQPVFNGIGSIIRGVWEGWLKPVFDKIIDVAKVVLPAAFQTMKDAIGKAWDAVQEVVKAPIRFIVETVIQKGIIENFNKAADFFKTDHLPNVSLPKGFAGGGILPGSSRMRDGDDQLVPMRRGEGVLVSEGLRTAADRQAFLAANAAGRRGVGFASLMGGGFATGGIVGAASSAWDWLAGKAGKAWNWAADAAGTAASVVSDPMGTLGKLADSLMAKIPGAGGILDLAKGVGKRILDGAVEKLKGIGDLGGLGPFGGNGANGNIPSTDLASALGFAPGSGVAATGGLLRKAAAAAWNSAYQASGGILRLTEGYRDLAGQAYRWSLFKKGGNLAAPVGTSKHGYGLAADVAGGQSWLRANGAKFGWANTGLGFAQREPWHFEFKGVPQLAAGGVVGRRPGGTLVNVGEGRYDEAVVPLTPAFKDGLGAGGQRVEVYVQNPFGSDYLLAQVSEVADARVADAFAADQRVADRGVRLPS
ncbi:tape measure protein [Curtobacterium sp. MCBA15_004]|uniref:tape measure protein n=1 Tax=Curtobacterium sp. MCBA15_004 TaxID=1898733 RepID=UPI0009F39ECE|nr:tape measure protein [Curtobacterium sp. MCBA15_004]WIA95798.1 tape measure protein [Curtobacterium sp. MCBA15_004]